MSKRVDSEIEFCLDCRHRGGYRSKRRGDLITDDSTIYYCGKSKRKDRTINSVYTIPDWCPLDDYDANGGDK
jgi:hypothetical protein